MSFNDEVAKFEAKYEVGKAWYASHQFYAGVIVGLVITFALYILARVLIP